MDILSFCFIQASIAHLLKNGMSFQFFRSNSQATMNLLANIYISSATHHVLISICDVVLWSSWKYRNEVFEHELLA